MDPILSREDIPSREDVQSMTREIEELEGKILDIDAKPLSGAHALPEQEHREELVQIATMKRFMCAPVRRMPTEILALIFEHHIGPWRSEGGDDPAYISMVRKAPFTLTHVCWRWRCIALDSPTIWTHIYIEPEYQSSTLQTVMSCIKHSRQLPLSIAIHGPRDHDILPSSACNSMLTVMTMLRKELHRCQRLLVLDLGLGNSQRGSSSRLFPYPTFTPILEELFVGDLARTSDILGLVTDLLGIVQRSPHLRTVDIKRSVYIEEVTLLIPASLSLRSLSFLATDALSSAEFFSLFTQFPGLCQLSCDELSIVGPEPDIHVTAEFLTSLTIKWEYCCPTDIYFQRLSAPALRELDISSSMSDHLHEDVGLFVNESYACSLTSLKLAGLDLMNIGAVLRPLIALEGLVIELCNGLVSALLELARPCGTGEFICPRLQKLRIEGWEPGILEALADLVAARGLGEGGGAHDRPSRLEELSLSVHDGIASETLQELQAMGVVLDICEFWIASMYTIIV